MKQITSKKKKVIIEHGKQNFSIFFVLNGMFHLCSAGYSVLSFARVELFRSLSQYKWFNIISKFNQFKSFVWDFSFVGDDITINHFLGYKLFVISTEQHLYLCILLILYYRIILLGWMFNSIGTSKSINFTHHRYPIFIFQFLSFFSPICSGCLLTFHIFIPP